MKKDGFTLIELMIVVIILASLAAMIVPRIMGRADDAKANIARAEIGSLTTALKLYKLDNGAYPTTQEGLAALMVKPASADNWKEPYLEKDPVDPWKRAYNYKYKGDHNTSGFDIWSLGAEETNGDDDVTNWD